MLKKPPVKISDVKAALEVLLTSLANTYSNKLSGKNSKIFSLPILINCRIKIILICDVYLCKCFLTPKKLCCSFLIIKNSSCFDIAMNSE